MSNPLPLPSPSESQSQPQPPETPPWDTPSSKWFTPINTPWRSTPRNTQTTPTEVIVSKSPMSHKSPTTTPKLDGTTTTEAEPLRETMVLLQLQNNRTSPWIWCGAALCFIFSILLIVFGIATLILYLAIRPKTPVFDISNAKLNTVYFQSSVNINGELLLVLNFTNPNKKLDVKIENISIQLCFSDRVIAKDVIPPFKQGNGKTRMIQISLLSSFLLPVNNALELRRQVVSNMIYYDIKSKFKVKAVLGMIHYSYWLYGSCQLQLNSPPTGGLLYRNCTTKRW